MGEPAWLMVWCAKAAVPEECIEVVGLINAERDSWIFHALPVVPLEDLMVNIQYSITLAFVGQMKDRFATYQEPRELAEKPALASRIEGAQGVEPIYPFDEPRDLRRAFSPEWPDGFLG